MELLPCPQSSIGLETRELSFFQLASSNNSSDVNFDGTVHKHGAVHERDMYRRVYKREAIGVHESPEGYR